MQQMLAVPGSFLFIHLAMEASCTLQGPDQFLTLVLLTLLCFVKELYRPFQVTQLQFSQVLLPTQTISTPQLFLEGYGHHCNCD